MPINNVHNGKVKGEAQRQRKRRTEEGMSKKNNKSENRCSYREGLQPITIFPRSTREHRCLPKDLFRSRKQMEGEDAVGRPDVDARRPPPWLRLAAAATTHGHSILSRHLWRRLGDRIGSELLRCLGDLGPGTSDSAGAGLSMADWAAGAHAALRCP